MISRFYERQEETERCYEIRTRHPWLEMEMIEVLAGCTDLDRPGDRE